jgi:hypothetical protein
VQGAQRTERFLPLHIIRTAGVKAPAVAAFRSSFRLCVFATRKRFLNFSEMCYFLPIRPGFLCKQLKLFGLIEFLLFFDRGRSHHVTLL